MNNFYVWLTALRLRTLPLAAASIITAAGIAAHQQIFDLVIFILSLSTALLLQVLSNLANDYGDAVTGADDEDRIGPVRAMQTGAISASSMKKAIIVTTLLSLLTGISLLVVALGDDLMSWFLFLGLGIAAILAAITYTMGSLPYGYRALGDISVFLFFGLLGVIGSFYLYNLSFDWLLLFPASSIGLLSASVLNVNNMRDLESDRKHNKITLVVLLGRPIAFKYHLALVITAPLFLAYYLYNLQGIETWQYIFLLSLIPLLKSCSALNKAIYDVSSTGELFNHQLKNTTIITFVIALLFALILIPQ